MPKAPDTAFNIWLGILDELLSKSVPMNKAMFLAGNKLIQLQKEYQGDLFAPNDLNWALESINILMKRSNPTLGTPAPPTVIDK